MPAVLYEKTLKKYVVPGERPVSRYGEAVIAAFESRSTVQEMPTGMTGTDSPGELSIPK